MPRTRLPEELSELIEKVARHPHGLGFLHQSYLETVAVTLGAHPFVVDAARLYLETPEGRAALIEEVRRARERLASGEEGPSSDGRAPEAAEDAADRGTEEAASLDPAGLIDAAETHPLGREFLLQAPPETVAVTFRVHPFVVFRARGLIRHRTARAARDDS